MSITLEKILYNYQKKDYNINMSHQKIFNLEEKVDADINELKSIIAQLSKIQNSEDDYDDCDDMNCQSELEDCIEKFQKNYTQHPFPKTLQVKLRNCLKKVSMTCSFKNNFFIGIDT